MKSIKVTLHGSYRQEIERLARETRLSFNQIVNHLWANGGESKSKLREQFAKKEGK